MGQRLCLSVAEKPWKREEELQGVIFPCMQVCVGVTLPGTEIELSFPPLWCSKTLGAGSSSKAEQGEGGKLKYAGFKSPFALLI